MHHLLCEAPLSSHLVLYSIDPGSLDPGSTAPESPMEPPHVAVCRIISQDAGSYRDDAILMWLSILDKAIGLVDDRDEDGERNE